jgi:hypothetical protein
VGRAGGSAQAAWRRTRAAEWAAWIPSADASTRSPALLVGMVTPLPPVVEANVVTGFRVTVTEPSGTVRPRSTWMVASAVGPIHWVVSVPSAAAERSVWVPDGVSRVTAAPDSGSVRPGSCTSANPCPSNGCRPAR